MKKKLSFFLAMTLLATCIFAGCGGSQPAETTKEPTKAEALVREVFYGENGEIPCLELVDSMYVTADVVRWEFTEVGKDGSTPYGIAEELISQEDAPIFNWYYGDGVYLSRYAKPNRTAYATLVDEMKKAGYQVYSQGTLNSGDVRYTLLTYQDFVYDVIYMINTNELMVTASKSRPLSPYLLEENPSTQSEAIDGLETTLTMLPWKTNGGDNYIIQLKNGHFILFDGGDHNMFRQTLDFLKANTPDGQIPVVEAWFITHGHYDHVGWTRCYLYESAKNGGLFQDGEAASQLIVNGIYYNMPEEYILDNTVYSWRSTEPKTADTGMRSRGESVWPYRVAKAAEYMRTENGEQTPIYRPQTGQTFYFKDLTVEVPYTQEHITFAEYQMDLNASSTWYLIRAEGRTFLDGGDTENVNLAHVERMYSSDYEIFGKGNVMSAFHHGHNIYSNYIDKFYAPIVFYTSKTMFSWASQYTQANKDMLARPNIRYYCYGDGGYQYHFATGEVTELK